MQQTMASMEIELDTLKNDVIAEMHTDIRDLKHDCTDIKTSIASINTTLTEREKQTATALMQISDHLIHVCPQHESRFSKLETKQALVYWILGVSVTSIISAMAYYVSRIM